MKINQLLVPSLSYRNEIIQHCNDLSVIGGIKYIVLYILFNNNQKFIISNTPEQFLRYYWFENLRQYDYSTNRETISGLDHYLCDQKLGAEPYFKEIIEEKFKMYRTFYIIRSCAECKFIFGALHDHQIENSVAFYNNVIDRFEDFCLDFVENTINIIKFRNPDYHRSIILNDKYYRRNVIKRLNNQKESLTERESECLFWAANGKSSEETALILKTKKTTIETYRKQIKEKFKCSNMAQAVYEGIKTGYIGAFNNCLYDKHQIKK